LSEGNTSLQVEADVLCEALDLRDQFLLFAVDSNEAISCPARESEADELKDEREHGQGVNSSDDGVGKIEG